MIKKWVMKGIFNLLIVFSITFVISASFYFYLSAKTEILSINDGLNIVKDTLLEKGLFESLALSVSNVFGLIVLQIAVFATSAISLLFVVWFIYQLYAIEKKSALIDPLTDINNRRAILFGLKREIARAKRFNHPLSVAIADIDYFKQYNDRNGHIAGDDALKKIARILSDNIRETDIVGRIGGEEFMIIFPETSLKDAARACNALRAIVKKTDFRREGALPGRALTISIGLAGIKKDSEIHDRDILIEIADKNLYKAKKRGRDIVIRG